MRTETRGEKEYRQRLHFLRDKTEIERMCEGKEEKRETGGGSLEK